MSTAKVAVAIIDICYDVKDFKGIVNHLQILSKKRGQLKQVWRPVPLESCRLAHHLQAITSIVQRAVGFVDKFTDAEMEQKLELISALRTITEGKVCHRRLRAGRP